ncbi:MAG: UvrD-helicase domain-containing protein [Porticoccaceae bacterium]|jgi:ATP-dependent DNA helicase Rep|nr:UvrD-helicase domain-containing protein [Porticoccaceae bacterium]
MNSASQQGLNKQQREAVRYNDGPALVLAGAGSGKTMVITQKIAWLLQNKNYTPRQITAVTFTNKAAREMDARIRKLIGAQSCRGLRICTFHRLGLDILNADLSVAGLRKGFSILDGEDSLKLLGDLGIRDIDSDQLALARDLISEWKNQLTSPIQAISSAADDSEYRAAKLYERYQEALLTYNAVDFDDLIYLPVILLREQTEIRNKWQLRMRHLLIDEYQDTNQAQYELVKILVQHHQKFTAVGDDDQSIYTWRGARPENLIDLSRDYPDLKVIRLEQNYRSTGRILKCANELIKNNSHLFEKTLWSDLGVGDPINLIRHKNDEEELDWIVQDIQYRMATKRRKFKDFAVLYRGNHQSRLLEMKLQGNGVPYSISGGTSFYSRSEIKDVMAYLRLLINPEDDSAFLRIINTPRRQIGPKTVEQLSRYAASRMGTLLQGCTEMGVAEFVSDPGLSRLREFGHWIERKAMLAETKNTIAIVRELLNDINYEGWLFESSSSAKSAEARWRNVQFLIDSIASTLSTEENAEGETLAEAVARTQLRDMLENMEENSADDKVSLMTLHASKGLEFKEVYLLGVEEGILPHQNSLEDDKLEEERRLFYVGITRARERLTLSLAGARKQFGDVSGTTPSRFIDELPQDDLDKQGFANSDPKASAEKAASARANLQALFS